MVEQPSLCFIICLLVGGSHKFCRSYFQTLGKLKILWRACESRLLSSISEFLTLQVQGGAQICISNKMYQILGPLLYIPWAIFHLTSSCLSFSHSSQWFNQPLAPHIHFTLSSPLLQHPYFPTLQGEIGVIGYELPQVLILFFQLVLFHFKVHPTSWTLDQKPSHFFQDLIPSLCPKDFAIGPPLYQVFNLFASFFSKARGQAQGHNLKKSIL